MIKMPGWRSRNGWSANAAVTATCACSTTALRLFLAVSKAKAGSVPEHWIRRQTLANEERFITPELKEREGRIFQLRARACQREYELYCSLREQVGAMAAPIRAAARGIACLDALSALADTAATGGWCAPVLSVSRQLDIVAGRHPVVEQLLVETSFTPNDLNLGNGTDLIVLTGPNASGKGCYLRQIGLIQLLAQIGSWVPATQPASASPIASSPGWVRWMISLPVSPPSWWRWRKPPTSCTTPASAPSCCSMRSARAATSMASRRWAVVNIWPAISRPAPCSPPTTNSTTWPPNAPTWPTSR